MTPVLRFTLRFLDPVPRFHGRGSDGDPEWPPSPLRFFQALVCAAATRWRDGQFRDYAEPALLWLESRPQLVVAPDKSEKSFGYRMYVPNNSGDLMTAAWARGDAETSMAKFRVEKDVRPTHLSGEAVNYLFPLADGDSEAQKHLEVLKAAARSVTHLGWGIDMVAADADVISEEVAAQLPGHRWRAVASGGVPLRVPKAGTLANLMEKHAAFLGRLSAEGFKPVPPLSCFDVVSYHSPTAGGASMPTRPLAAFEIHRTIEEQENEPGRSKFRPFHHVRRVATVAGMVRHATATVARRIGWSAEEVMRRAEGHDDTKDGQSTSEDRLLFLPLPSITPVGVSGIRRVLVVGPPGFDLAPLRRQLNGEELNDRDTCQPVAMLSGVGSTDKGVLPFVGESHVWSTVTPVILPGYDDPDGLRKKLKERDGKSADDQKHLLERLDRNILKLIWKSFHQAGWTADALTGVSVEYRTVGWFRGLDLARNYDLPPLKFPRYHLCVRFPRKVRGPIAIGAGRYRGFGLMAVDPDR